MSFMICSMWLLWCSHSTVIGFSLHQPCLLFVVVIQARLNVSIVRAREREKGEGASRLRGFSFLFFKNKIKIVMGFNQNFQFFLLSFKISSFVSHRLSYFKIFLHSIFQLKILTNTQFHLFILPPNESKLIQCEFLINFHEKLSINQLTQKF